MDWPVGWRKLCLEEERTCHSHSSPADEPMKKLSWCQKLLTRYARIVGQVLEGHNLPGKEKALVLA